MVPLKAGDGTAFRKLFNFVIKCQIIEVDGHYNPLYTPEIICTVLSKLPLKHHTAALKKIFKRISADRPSKLC